MPTIKIGLERRTFQRYTLDMPSSIPFHDTYLFAFYRKQLGSVEFLCVFLAGLAIVFVQYLLAVPSELRHLPRVSPFATIWSYVLREPVDSRVRRLILPFARRGEGVVLVYMLGKWGVHVLDANVSFLHLNSQHVNSKFASSLSK